MTPPEPAPPLRSDLFFTAPEALPKGRHGLDRGEVIAHQRERLLIAVTELLAELGYRAMGVRDIATRAGVSQAGFYACFADKDEAVFTAYERCMTVLAERILTVMAEPASWEQVADAVVRTYLRTLQEDLVVARAYIVEIDALGEPARRRRRESLDALAALLKHERDRRWPGAEDVPLIAYRSGIYAVRQVASDRIDDEPEPDLAVLADELVPSLVKMLA